MGQRIFDLRYHLIAAKACEATMAYYHEFLREFAEEIYPGHEFLTQVMAKGYPYFARKSSGRNKSATRERFKVVYSEQDVADMEGPYAERRARFLVPDLGFHEIDIMGYAEGIATPESMIVHTICHEIAHFVDFLKNGDRKAINREMHDEMFYHELTNIYEVGGYDWLLKDLRVRLRLAGIPLRQFCLLPDWDFVLSSSDEFECGDKVIVFDCKIRRNPSLGVLVKKHKSGAKVALGDSPDWAAIPDDIMGDELACWAQINADHFVMYSYVRMEKDERFYPVSI